MLSDPPPADDSEQPSVVQECRNNNRESTSGLVNEGDLLTSSLVDKRYSLQDLLKGDLYQA